jgi:hypothetical protein
LFPFTLPYFRIDFEADPWREINTTTPLTGMAVNDHTQIWPKFFNFIIDLPFWGFSTLEIFDRFF